jgi:hypothetical protein
MATMRTFRFVSRHFIDNRCRTCWRSELFSKYWYVMTTESLDYISSALVNNPFVPS